jgi:antitoxin component of MazEF toxin-antitoxin module
MKCKIKIIEVPEQGYNMRLQKQLSRKVGNKEYAKYVIVVPPKTIEALEWKDGENLEAEAKENKLIIRRKR